MYDTSSREEEIIASIVRLQNCKYAHGQCAGASGTLGMLGTTGLWLA